MAAISVEIDDPDIISVKKIEPSEFNPPMLTDTYTDVFAYDVTCVGVGDTDLTFLIGNTPSSTNPRPVQSSREVRVTCDAPKKLVVKAEPRKMEEDDAKYVADPKTGRIMAHNYRDLLLGLTVKNAKGATFNDISSLKFDFKVSDRRSNDPTK